jgi:hypothetical protein
MREQTSPDDPTMPNRASNQEKAEGSRETIEENAPEGGGITNRPLEEERDEQHSLPPRGESKTRENPTLPDDDATLRTEI